MMSVNQKTRRAASIAGILLATVISVTACSDKNSTASNKPSKSPSPVASTKGSNEKAAAADSAGDQATSEKNVAAWVAAVIKGDLKKACLLMADPATDSSAAKVGNEEICGDGSPKREDMEKGFGGVREAFTPGATTDDPKVEVAQLASSGKKVVVSADKIIINGQPLKEIVLSHSSGVASDQMDINVESSKIDKSWYVTNVNYHIG